jgi:hypothetical protein
MKTVGVPLTALEVQAVDQLIWLKGFTSRAGVLRAGLDLLFLSQGLKAAARRRIQEGRRPVRNRLPHQVDQVLQVDQVKKGG